MLASLAGCGSGGAPVPGRLEPEAFRSGPDRPPSVIPSANRANRPVLVARSNGSAAPLDISARAGDPETAGDAKPTGGAALIDAKIGDINGQPIWASEFFDENLSARLRANAAKIDGVKVTRREWLDETRKIIDERLQARIDNILMKDEGLAQLTPEMKSQGLSAVLNQWMENQKSRNMGSAELANQAVRENQSQYYDSLDKAAQEFENMVLIHLMTDKLDKSINVSAADIRRFYYANLEMFDPPPVAVFSMIVVGRDRRDDAAAARWALESGALFSDVASLRLNTYKPDQAGHYPEIKFTGDYAKADLFGAPAMAAAARGLAPGEWTGPFDDRGSLVFLRLDRIVKDTVSLYDAQLAIDTMLRNTEFQARMRQRIDRLKSRSSLTDQGEMARRLMDFAEAKFLPST